VKIVVSPFEEENGLYYVLVNGEKQYSLWPNFAAVPQGWTIAYGADGRVACLAFVDKNWIDMRPASLIEEMNNSPDIDQHPGGTANKP
jgi:uncharacterized protein YbdZ (MbtH family)